MLRSILRSTAVLATAFATSQAAVASETYEFSVRLFDFYLTPPFHYGDFYEAKATFTLPDEAFITPLEIPTTGSFVISDWQSSVAPIGPVTGRWSAQPGGSVGIIFDVPTPYPYAKTGSSVGFLSTSVQKADSGMQLSTGDLFAVFSLETFNYTSRSDGFAKTYAVLTSASVVPEASTMAYAALGLVGLAGAVRRSRKDN